MQYEDFEETNYYVMMKVVRFFGIPVYKKIYTYPLKTEVGYAEEDKRPMGFQSASGIILKTDD